MKQHQRHPKASKASQKNSSQEDPNLTILSSSTLSTNDQKRNTNHLKYFSTPNLDHQSSSIFPCLFSSDNDQTLKKIGNDSSKNESFYQEHIFEVTLKCFCKKTFSKKWRFLKHLKAFHNFHLLSELYPKFRMILQQQGMNIDFQQEHRGIINNIRFTESREFSVPLQMTKRFTVIYKKSALNKFYQMKVNKYLLQIGCGKDFIIEEKKNQKQKYDLLLSEDFIKEWKILVLKEIIQFQRRIHIFIKNICIAEVIQIFLYNFVIEISPSAKELQSKSTIQFFQQTIKDFKDWINFNFKKVFTQNLIFYHYFQPGKLYCDSQRTCNITLLIKYYLRKKQNLGFSNAFLICTNYILLCLQEYCILQDLVI